MSDAIWHIAQMNVGTSRFPLDDPRMNGFMQRLDDINALADATPGFVWRLQSDSGNATDIDVGESTLFIVNMSVWTDIESLFGFVYQSAHQKLMVNRRDWFDAPVGSYQALWWIRAGHEPTPDEGLERIAHLNRSGPSADAFNFKKRFPPPKFDGLQQSQATEPGV